MKRKALLLGLSLLAAGCTTPATKLAIQNYRRTEEFKELSFNNTYRIASEQMLLNLTQYTDQHSTEPDKVKQAIVLTWSAREQLETARVQFIMAKSLTMLTVGQYLYDQQGWVNALLGTKASQLKDVSVSADAANKAAGTTSVKDLIPHVDSTTRPSTLDAFKDQLHKLNGK